MFVSYLDVYNDLGAVGLLVLMGFLVFFVRQALQLFKADRTQGILYLGLFFVLMVMFVPGGVARLLMKQAPLIAAHKLRRMLPSYSIALGAGLVLLAGSILTVELIYKLQMDSDNGSGMTLAGFDFDAASLRPWAIASVLLIAGALGWRAAVRRVYRAWDEIQTEMAGGVA